MATKREPEVDPDKLSAGASTVYRTLLGKMESRQRARRSFVPRILDWYDRVPTGVKVLLLLAGALLSASYGRLPEAVQDIGLWFGVALAAVAIFGLLLHAVKEARGGHRVEPNDLITIGLVGLITFGVITLGGFIWQAMYHRAQATPSPAIASDIGAWQPLKPSRYYSQADKERIAEALFELSQLSNKQLTKLAEEAERLYVPWETHGANLDNETVARTEAELANLRKETEAVRDAFYVTWLRDYQDYAEDLRPVLYFEELGGIHPIVKFSEALQRFQGALEIYRTISTGYKIEGEDRSRFVGALRPHLEAMQWGVGNLVDWREKIKRRISEKRQQLSEQTQG